MKTQETKRTAKKTISLPDCSEALLGALQACIRNEENGLKQFGEYFSNLLRVQKECIEAQEKFSSAVGNLLQRIESLESAISRMIDPSMNAKPEPKMVAVVNQNTALVQRYLEELQDLRSDYLRLCEKCA